MYDSRPTEPSEDEWLPEECPICCADNADVDGEPLYEDTIHCSEWCAQYSTTNSYSWRGADNASYVGDEFDGAYYSVGRGPRGWYLTVLVDCDTAGFMDVIVNDQGPYGTEDVALEEGKNAATEWCWDNNVRTHEEVSETRESEGWTTTLSALL